MTKRKIIIGLVIIALIALAASQSMSQTRRNYRPRTRSNRFQPPPGLKPPQFGPKNSSSSSSSTRREVTDKSKEKSIQGAVGASDEQWRKIKPMLEQVKQLQVASMSIITGGGGSGGSASYSSPQGRVRRNPKSAGGGSSSGGFLRGVQGGSSTLTAANGSRFNMSWAWDKPWYKKGAQREDEKLCDRLFNLLRSNRANEQQIKQTMATLKKAREQTKKELVEAQQKLRENLTLEQEARLIVLGWLD
jgi:hypothetical protein